MCDVAFFVVLVHGPDSETLKISLTVMVVTNFINRKTSIKSTLGNMICNKRWGKDQLLLARQGAHFFASEKNKCVGVVDKDKQSYA